MAVFVVLCVVLMCVVGVAYLFGDFVSRLNGGDDSCLPADYEYEESEDEYR